MKRTREPEPEPEPELEPESQCDPQVDLNFVTSARPVDIVAPKPISATIVVCDMPPCKRVPFDSYASYETHVIEHHNHVCLQCHKRFPTQTILEIHIEEFHSELWKLRVERGDKVFRCLEPGCKKLCASVTKRRRHLIDKHNYPHKFPFSIVKTGLTA